MPVHQPDPPASQGDSSDVGLAAHPGHGDLDDPDLCRGDEPRPGPESHRGVRHTRRVAADHESEALPAAGESNYDAAALNRPTRRGDLWIELPEVDPVITPGVAGALLRLILKAAGDQPDVQHPPRSGST